MKRLLPYVFLFVLLLAAGGFGWYWWQTGRYIETTDNAYIRGDITPISTKVAGYVESVLVADNQIVRAGEPLVRIQDMEFKVRMERGRNNLLERQAALLGVEGKRNQQSSKIALAKAQLVVAEVNLQRDTEVYRKFDKLFAEEVISWFEYNEALTNNKKALAEKSGAEASLEMAKQELNVLLAEEQRIAAEIGQHQEDLKLLQQEVADTKICAPISGTVGNRRVQTGQYVRPGSVLMALIPLNDVWVEANFKEVQLARMQEGQQVEIEVDAFPDHHFSGRVQSLSPASGAEFSLLPPENASGNFTKIVQRIPVKITVDKNSHLDKRLLPGMSVEVSINTKAAPSSEQKELAGLQGRP
jgi:membrane fusion protein (multidrug efflux system)